ncbi:MAG: YciI family protein, partial [bacterium]
MHKVDAHMEAGGPPSQTIIEAMGKLVQDGLKSGVFLDGAGLHRSALRVRVEVEGGKPTVTRGPY